MLRASFVFALLLSGACKDAVLAEECMLARVVEVFQESSSKQSVVRFDELGKQMFERFTTEHLGRRVMVFSNNGKPLMLNSTKILTPMSGGMLPWRDEDKALSAQEINALDGNELRICLTDEF